MLRRLWLAALLGAYILALLGATTASGTQVQLTISVRGKGTVIAGGHRIVCNRVCIRTFDVRPGTVRLKAVAAPTWKFTTWRRGCHGNKAICIFRIRRSTRVTATFIPPGAKQNPIPLGHEATVRETWLLKVISVTPDADDLVRAASNNAPRARVPRGKQDYMVRVSAMFVGGGGGDLGNGLIGYVEAVGSRGVLYDTVANGCPGTWPSPSFQGITHRIRTVFGGKWHTGNVCYLIASRDADSLRLFVYPVYPPSGNYSRTIWFALR